VIRGIVLNQVAQGQESNKSTQEFLEQLESLFDQETAHPQAVQLLLKNIPADQLRSAEVRDTLLVMIQGASGASGGMKPAKLAAEIKKATTAAELEKLRESYSARSLHFMSSVQIEQPQLKVPSLARPERTAFVEKIFASEESKARWIEEQLIREEDFPESYFESLRERDRRRDLGDQAITAERRKAEIASKIGDQRSSLAAWVEYLSSGDASYLSDEFKGWILNEVSGLKALEAGAKSFANRSKDTVGAFPELNREALGSVVDQAKRQESLNGFKFKDHYFTALQSASKSVQGLDQIDGQWVIFKKGSDPKRLVAVLQGRCTGWCTASLDTASSQLSQGDFHVYLS
jgi:hypothetical protein